MGNSFKGKNLLPRGVMPPEGANYFPYEQFLILWKITYHINLPPLNVTFFITHLRNLRNGCCVNGIFHKGKQWMTT